jgi:DNA-binding transcriptional regulator of glucitol operon
VRERWLSKRAFALHVAVLVFVPGCGLAAWWQITRATDGNGLSYLYAVEWPIFAILSAYFWWMFIHTDYETVGLKGMRRQAATASAPAPVSSPAPPVLEVDDPELAAYNARLAALAAEGPKTWRQHKATAAGGPQ